MDIFAFETPEWTGVSLGETEPHARESLIRMIRRLHTGDANSILSSALALVQAGERVIDVVQFSRTLGAKPTDLPHAFRRGAFSRGERGYQLPEETCAVCERDPHNQVHQGAVRFRRRVA